jgi:3-oxoacyl-ACP reductase-like protein
MCSAAGVAAGAAVGAGAGVTAGAAGAAAASVDDVAAGAGELGPVLQADDGKKRTATAIRNIERFANIGTSGGDSTCARGRSEEGPARAQ